MFSSMKRNADGRARGGGVGLSFVGVEMVVSGNVASTATVHIDGRVEGDVGCATLVMGEGGTVAGNIEADHARIAGLVDGTVRGRIVTLEATARVTGDVTYETLSIAAGAQIEGRLARKEAIAGNHEPPEALPAPKSKAQKKAVRKPSQPVLPALDAPSISAPAA